MNPVTRDWIKKAEGDFSIACREIRARKAPNYDGVCFHAQQCAEKYLKARLHAAGVRFSRTHNLGVLIDLAKKIEPEWEVVRPAARMLTDFAVRFRYPGAFATKTQAREAVKACELFRERARMVLRLAARPTKKPSSKKSRAKLVTTKRRKRS